MVNNQSGYFQDIFGEQTEFTNHERKQIKLFAIGAFLKRHTEARRKYLPEVEDTSGIDVAIARLAEEAVVRRGVVMGMPTNSPNDLRENTNWHL